MPQESFLLVSLKDAKTKRLAQVISNETSRKILEYLSNSTATESELAEKLNIPISTVHYNLKHLIKAKLVRSDEFHYSEKGKEVNHYRIANKYIIITPEKVSGIKSKLRSILPVWLLAIVGAAVLHFSSIFRVAGSIDEKAYRAAPMLAEAAVEDVAAPVLTQGAGQAMASPAIWQSIGVWYVAGATFVVLCMIVLEWLKSRKG